MRTRVKICGFTRVEDAVNAAFLGVDAIGLVFYRPSPRNIEIPLAIQIVKALPAFVSVVALFVNEKDARIKEVLEQVNIDCIQFHGDESAAFCRSFGKPYIKAIRMRQHLDIRAISQEYQDAAALLLDAYHPDEQGGTGSRFDWQMIPQDFIKPIILAGGLAPGIAQQAVQMVKPYALDVSSGVEADKGIKDAAKMAAFIKEVNEADKS